MEAVYLFAACWALAQVEIQIEGSQGWAERLPTWRLASPWVLKIMNGKHITGYHLYLNLFLLLMLHFPVIYSGFSWNLEAKIVSTYFFMSVFWDFQWFVWNPFWGVRRFLTQRVWWFPKKWFGLPVEYYSGAAVSFLATWLLAKENLSQWAATFSGLVILSLLSVAVAQFTRWRPKLNETGS